MDKIWGKLTTLWEDPDTKVQYLHKARKLIGHSVLLNLPAADPEGIYPSLLLSLVFSGRLKGSSFDDTFY